MVQGDPQQQATDAPAGLYSKSAGAPVAPWRADLAVRTRQSDVLPCYSSRRSHNFTDTQDLKHRPDDDEDAGEHGEPEPKEGACADPIDEVNKR